MLSHILSLVMGQIATPTADDNVITFLTWALVVTTTALVGAIGYLFKTYINARDAKDNLLDKVSKEHVELLREVIESSNTQNTSNENIAKLITDLTEYINKLNKQIETLTSVNNSIEQNIKIELNSVLNQVNTKISDLGNSIKDLERVLKNG